MKALIYARCSTDHQTKEEGGVSIENQLDRCRDYVERKGWTLAGDPIIDEAVSGGLNKARSGFMALLDRIEQNGIDVLVVYSLERLSRDMLTLLALDRLLDESDISLHTVEGEISTRNPDQWLTFAMKALLSEHERRTVKYRTKRALEFKKDRGEVVGHVGYGYRRNGNALEPVEEEQRLIALVNRLYREGRRLVDITKHLNETGTPTRAGNPWKPQQVKRLIEEYQPVFHKQTTRMGEATRTFIEAVA